MKVKVLGIQFVDYVSRKTGNPVKGVTLHSCYPDGQVKGEAVDSIFVSDNLCRFVKHLLHRLQKFMKYLIG